MLKAMKNNYQNLSFFNLNNSLLIISFMFFIISLILVKNTVLIVIMVLFIAFLLNKIEMTKITRFLNYLSFIITLALILISFLNLSFINIDVIIVFKNVVKILLFSQYSYFVYYIIKNKKIKFVRKRKSIYTFKELRSNNYDLYFNLNENYIENYVEKENISYESDYYKIINNNLDNKSKNDLEEYVWINYLRFYKNRGLHHLNIFDKFNLVFIGIHVIILMLSFLVR